MAKKSFVDWLYTTAPGRMTLKVLLYTCLLYTSDAADD